MFREPVTGSNSPSSKPGWEPCIVLLVKTRYLNSNTLQPVNALGTGDLCPGKPCDGLASHPVMSKNTSSHLVRQNRDKPPGLSGGPLGSHADFLSIMQKALYILFLLFSTRLLMIALFYIFGTYTVSVRN